MVLRSHLEYSRMKDDIIGHEDIGPGATSCKKAENLLMFMIRSLFGGWSEIIGHHFVPAVFPKEKLQRCVMEKLAALHSYGLICAAIVCDQEPGHVSLFNSMGVTRHTPFIKCPYSDRSVYILYDPPHLLKSTRNNFLNYNFLDEDGNVSKLSDVADMFTMDKRRTLRKAPKLTEDHFNPSVTQKMKVGMAAQLFSHSTSAAMTSMLDDLSPSAPTTSRMLHMFNDIFDFLNSRSLSEVGTQRVVLKQLWTTQQKQIDNWLQYIDGITFIPVHGRRRRTKTFPFKQGWLITLESVRRLIDDCFTMTDVFFVRTRRLNQDILENCFSAIRGRGGWNDHPTTRQAASAVAALFTNNFLRKELAASSSVENLDEDIVELIPCTQKTSSGSVTLEGEEEEEHTISLPIAHQATSSSLSIPSCKISVEDVAEPDTLKYVVGSFFKRLGCEECSNKLCARVDESSASGLTAARLYEGAQLLEPTASISQEVAENMTKVLAFVNANLDARDIAKKACDLYPLSDNQFCSFNHRDSFSLLYVQLIVRVHCKLFNRTVRDNARKISKKMKKF